MTEEAETTQATIPEKAEKAEELPKQSEKEETIEPPAPKKRGRPAGSKDTAPRRPRTKIIEEPPTPPPEPEPVAKKPRVKAVVEAPKPAPAPAAAPPMSPRTAFRHASDHISVLQEQKEHARRAYWQDAITRSLG